MVNLEHLKSRWPSSIVARSKLADFSGGILTEKYLANLDAQGLGPPRVRIGRKIAYPVEELVRWLENRATPCDEFAE